MSKALAGEVQKHMPLDLNMPLAKSQ